MSDNTLVDADTLKRFLYGSYEEVSPIVIKRIMPLGEALERTEEQLIKMAAEKYGSSYRVAEVLETSQATAHRKIKKYLS